MGAHSRCAVARFKKVKQGLGVAGEELVGEGALVAAQEAAATHRAFTHKQVASLALARLHVLEGDHARLGHEGVSAVEAIRNVLPDIGARKRLFAGGLEVGLRRWCRQGCSGEGLRVRLAVRVCDMRGAAVGPVCGAVP